MNDTLDDIFEDSGDEEESHDIVNQVLDEIGIEISGKVRATRFTRVWDEKLNFTASVYCVTTGCFIKGAVCHFEMGYYAYKSGVQTFINSYTHRPL